MATIKNPIKYSQHFGTEKLSLDALGVMDPTLNVDVRLFIDLLVIEGNGSIDQTGRLALWDGSISPCVHRNHLIKVHLAAECPPAWIISWLMYVEGRRQIRAVAGSTFGLYTLSISKISNFPIPLPPKPEQMRTPVEATQRLLSQLGEVERLENRVLKRLMKTRQSHLTQCFLGLGSKTPHIPANGGARNEYSD